MKDILIILLALLAIPGAIVVSFLLIGTFLGAGVWVLLHLGHIIVMALVVGIIYLIAVKLAA